MTEIAKLSQRDLSIMIVVITIGITCSFGIDMHLPSLPSIVKHFHSTVGTGQLSVSLYVMSMTVCLLIYGPISDRLGRKPVILFGLIVAVLGSIACIFSSSMWFFLLGRLIQGIGAAVGLGLGRSLLNDIFDQKMMVRYGAYVSMTLALGLMTGPVLGGYTQAWLGWRGTFSLMGALFIFDILVVILLLKETATITNHRGQPALKIIKDYSYLLKQPSFFIFSCCTGLGLGLTLVYSSMSSFIFLGEYTQTPVSYGWISTLVGVGALLGKTLSGQLSTKLGVRKGVVVGFGFYLLVGIVVFLLNALIGLWMYAFIGLIFLGTFGQGFINVNTIAGALSSYRSMGGTASALYGSLQSFIGFSVSLIISTGGFHSIASLAISYGALSLIGLLLLYFQRDILS